ncbi:hypothetical protein D5086_009316, partial [Populus alba]
SCSMCGKVLSMLTWHKKLNIRNPRSKRTKRRRNNVQVADDECSVNVVDGLLDTAKRPSVKVNKDSLGSPQDFFSNLQGVGIKAKKQRGLGFVHASGAESTLTSVEERWLPVTCCSVMFSDQFSKEEEFENRKNGRQGGISESEVTVGRLPEKADMVIPVATVSALHARIQKKEGTLVVTYLDSTNGTFIDEKRLRPGLLELLSVYRLEVVSHLVHNGSMSEFLKLYYHLLMSAFFYCIGYSSGHVSCLEACHCRSSQQTRRVSRQVETDDRSNESNETSS